MLGPAQAPSHSVYVSGIALFFHHFFSSCFVRFFTKKIKCFPVWFMFFLRSMVRVVSLHTECFKPMKKLTNGLRMKKNTTNHPCQPMIPVQWLSLIVSIFFVVWIGFFLQIFCSCVWSWLVQCACRCVIVRAGPSTTTLSCCARVVRRPIKHPRLVGAAHNQWQPRLKNNDIV